MLSLGEQRATARSAKPNPTPPPSVAPWPAWEPFVTWISPIWPIERDHVVPRTSPYRDWAAVVGEAHESARGAYSVPRAPVTRRTLTLLAALICSTICESSV